jgi:FtsH-binding integral membrane protein
MQYPYALTGERAVARQRSILNQVYLWMTAGLLVTGAMAGITARSQAMLDFIYGNIAVFFVLLIVEIGLVVTLVARIQTLSAGAATAIFIGYAALNGLTLAAILLYYTKASIASTFFVTAGTFAVMSAIGYTTKRDLSRVGSIALMGLIGIILASIVNIFLHSSGIYWIVNFLGVIIFVALTASDTQKIKRLIAQTDDAGAPKVAIMGALTLYLDFINLFLFLLRIFGQVRD